MKVSQDRQSPPKDPTSGTKDLASEQLLNKVIGLEAIHTLCNGTHPGARLSLTTAQLVNIMDQLRNQTLSSDVLKKISDHVKSDLEFIGKLIKV
jgi:hypothetical protein